MPWISFSYVDVLAGTSMTLLNRSEESRHVFLFSGLRKKALSLSLLIMMWIFLWMSFISLKNSFLFLLFSFFYHERVLILFKCFFCVYRRDHGCFMFVCFVPFICYITLIVFWLLNEPCSPEINPI